MSAPTFGEPKTDDERALHALLGGRFGVRTMDDAVFASLGVGVELWVYQDADYPNGSQQWVAGVCTEDGEGHNDLDDYITDRSDAVSTTMAGAVKSAIYASMAATTAADARIARFRSAVTAARQAMGAGVTKPAPLNLGEVLAEATAWRDATFGNGAPLASRIAKLAGEVGELRQAAEAGESRERQMEELADVVLCAIGVARAHGDLGDLAAAIADKLAVNRKRTWRQGDDEQFHGSKEGGR